MLFKVYAGSIFCGVLQVFVNSGTHIFIDGRLNRIDGLGYVERVGKYKRLSLKRVL